VHAVETVLCSGELEFAGQSSQAAAPAPALYVPTTHAMQVPPLLPEKPVLHVQAVERMLPARELELAGHTSHAIFPDNVL